MHNFQFFISPLEMGKKEIFITAVCNMSFMLLRNAIRLPGSGPKGLEEEQIFWFGHPWQAVPFPACSLPVPGQSVKIEEKYIKSDKKNLNGQFFRSRRENGKIHKILRSGAFSGTSAILYVPASLRLKGTLGACSFNSKETWRKKARVIFC